MSIVKLDILAHADFSGRLRKTKRCPGHAVFGREVENIRAKNPEGTLLLDAGDEFCTTFWPGEPMVEAVSLIGTDAMTLGNHEFDKGKDFLDKCIAKADFPILCANMYEKATGELIPGVKPWVMLERQGIKIGVLGLTTEYTPYMVTAASFAPYEARSCVEAAEKYIPEMKAAGAQILVALTHIPFYIEDDGSVSGEMIDIMNAMPFVDVCIGGHIPGDFAGVCGNTVVVKGGFGGVSLCHAILEFDTEKGEVVSRAGEMIITDWDAVPIEVLKAHADKVTDPFTDFFEKPLAHTDETWTIRLSAETKLNNFFAQCVQEAAGVDFAYMNATSAGGTIAPGTVTAEDITAVMGFNDPILRAEISGDEIYELFEMVYEPERFGNNAGLMYSGVVVYADHTKPAGEKILNITLRDGSPLQRDKIYSVASSEYMSSGGNGTAALANRLKWEEIGVRVYDSIFGYLEKYGYMRVSEEQRMHEIGRPENDNSPF